MTPLDHVHVDVVGERRGAGEGEPGHHREDGGEGDGGDEAQEQGAAELLREQRRRHVAALVDGGDRVAAHERGGAEADQRDDEVEVADEAARPEHRDPRRPGVGDGVEAHQDVRQAEQAQHQREPQRDRVERAGDEPAGLERRLPVALRTAP